MTSVAIGHDTQIGLQCCEGIVGDFRFCRRHSREQCRLSGIGEAYQTDVRQQFQLHDNRHFLHRFARLCEAGSLTGGGFEVPVTQSAASAFQQNDFLTMLGYIADVFTGFGIVHYRAAGHFDYFILSVLAETCRFLEPDSPWPAMMWRS